MSSLLPSLFQFGVILSSIALADEAIRAANATTTTIEFLRMTAFSCESPGTPRLPVGGIVARWAENP